MGRHRLGQQTDAWAILGGGGAQYQEWLWLEVLLCEACFCTTEPHCNEAEGARSMPGKTPLVLTSRTPQRLPYMIK